MDKAYKNLHFLTSPEARTIRILAEYSEPEQRFERLGVERAVIFFGSARLQPGNMATPDGVDYYLAATELAGKVANWTKATHPHDQRYHVCTGGGPGIMEAANKGAYQVDPELSVGFNISLPFEQGVNPYIDDQMAFEFHYFFMRKFWFMNLAKGLVIFPGGFGTMDELFEVLTLVQTGKSQDMPVVLYGKKFWQGLINFPMFVEQGLIAAEDLERIHFAEDVDDALRYLTGRLTG
jgi:uncharacterized protein (TIGR00730 family)